MQIFKDLWAKEIRLTDERRAHILSHPEMERMVEAIPRTLAAPDTITISRSDPAVRLYYRSYPRTPVTEKYMCVVVKILVSPEAPVSDAFIITAYLTDTIKRGQRIWTAASKE